MRDILFRGKRVYDGKWSESVCPHGEMHSGTVTNDYDRNTVGEYTGLTDKKGKKVFEGDIVKAPFLCAAKKKDMIGIVEYRKGMFNFKHREEEFGRQLLGYVDDMEVIGNIFDNPELLTEKQPTNETEIMDDGEKKAVEKQGYLESTDKKPVRIPKTVALIKLCGGAVVFNISDMCGFIPPTEEQRKNMKEMLCIDVEMLEE